MKKVDLLSALSSVDEQTVLQACPKTEARRSVGRRLPLWVCVLFAVFCISGSALAVSVAYRESAGTGIRYLSPQDIRLEGDDSPDAERLFAALTQDDLHAQYIAVNRLVECYNDPVLRARALEAVRPLLSSPEAYVADAAAFAADILSESFSGERLLHLADGSIVFTLFGDYSEYGSYPELWRLQNGTLEKYFSFTAPSLYIMQIGLSPDGDRLAVLTCSNKSQYLTVLCPQEQTVSSELIGSARILCAAQNRFTFCERIDHENYSYLTSLQWQGNDRLLLTGVLDFDGAHPAQNFTADYCISQKTLLLQ